MNKQSGFTLIETLIAIFLLTLTVGALLQLAAGGFYSVRYARNQMVATALLQESLEYMHSSRDTASIAGTDWQTWLTSFSVNQNGTPIGDTSQGCFSRNGCIVDPYTTVAKVRACDSTCPPITFFTSSGLYGYSSSTYLPINGQSVTSGTATSYVRTITMQINTPDQVTVNTSVTWLNGSSSKTVTQPVLLTKWK
ncbi:MAG: seg [Candidatus Nomurabacteria bacterium]|nr:seg [Candidatus Nomurabacteria bacterium]